MSEKSIPWPVLFLVSAALNILTLGAALGYWLGGGGGRGGAETVGLAAPAAVMAALPAEVQPQVQRDLALAWSRAQEEREALRVANDQVIQQMQAEPYDAAAMQGALLRRREAGAAIIGRFQGAVAETLSRLTPEQRRAATAALIEQRRDFRARRREGEHPLLERRRERRRQ